MLILLVEPNDELRSKLRATAHPLAKVEDHSDFETAHARVTSVPFDFLVTNIRLGAYNGLHLVYLTSAVEPKPRAIVYSDLHEAGLAREAQRAGSFYEFHECLTVTLGAYLTGTLPERDRRDFAVRDRRAVIRGTRGGRRLWDVHLASRTR